MQLTMREKLKLCWEILFLGVRLDLDPDNKKEFIFTKGYETGLRDVKKPGTYKVTIHRYESQTSHEYLYDSLTDALDHVNRFYATKDNPGDSCDFVQTHLDRDMSFLVHG